MPVSRLDRGAFPQMHDQQVGSLKMTKISKNCKTLLRGSAALAALGVASLFGETGAQAQAVCSQGTASGAVSPSATMRPTNARRESVPALTSAINRRKCCSSMAISLFECADDLVKCPRGALQIDPQTQKTCKQSAKSC